MSACSFRCRCSAVRGGGQPARRRDARWAALFRRSPVADRSRDLRWTLDCLLFSIETRARRGYSPSRLAAKLERDARLADIGCGHGAPLILLARAYPASTFVGVDHHVPSDEAARGAAAQAGVSDRLTFEVADADAGKR
ncbi:methyltransferase domain-containing protein [Phytoactinopolyspora sp. XMNu-373]|uniref:Methyltransferase domain-containing protein n=1 Tax=Phytoactinopolyspora mesophila TaxID=2650750 RepID=A0A7K3M8E8_9ACTN|nr:methyltransferase domain-containing protein [Phytoactinopolyspora mesophila]